jgi:hypothetical protein
LYGFLRRELGDPDAATGSRSASAEIEIGPDGSLSFDVPPASQRYQSVFLAGTPRSRPDPCATVGNCNFAATGGMMAPRIWAARARAFRQG